MMWKLQNKLIACCYENPADIEKFQCSFINRQTKYFLSRPAQFFEVIYQ